MFTRIAINYLRQWAEKEERKPLVLRGARQVGKTTLVDLFAKDFEYYIYINLEEKENANLFANYSSFEDLLSGIFFKAKTTANSGRTLIFIDERTNQMPCSHFAISMRSDQTFMSLLQDRCSRV